MGLPTIRYLYILFYCKAGKMVKITFELDEPTDNSLRLLIGREGFKRGALQDAIVEAIQMWISFKLKEIGRENKNG